MESILNANRLTTAHIHVDTALGWSKCEAIVGRGVLPSYMRYSERNSIKYYAMPRYCTILADLETIAKEEGVEFKTGYLLIVRSWWIEW